MYFDEEVVELLTKHKAILLDCIPFTMKLHLQAPQQYEKLRRVECICFYERLHSRLGILHSRMFNSCDIGLYNGGNKHLSDHQFFLHDGLIDFLLEKNLIHDTRMNRQASFWFSPTEESTKDFYNP